MIVKTVFIASTIIASQTGQPRHLKPITGYLPEFYIMERVSDTHHYKVRTTKLFMSAGYNRINIFPDKPADSQAIKTVCFLRYSIACPALAGELAAIYRGSFLLNIEDKIINAQQ